MRNLKIFISLILVLASLLSLSGCTSGKKESENEDVSKVKLNIKDGPTEDSTEEDSTEEDSKKEPAITIVPNKDIAATINGKGISCVVMNYYFTDYIKNMYSTWQQQYGDNTSTMLGFMGIDANVPLNKQYVDEAKTQTFADYYLDAALTKAKNDYAFYDKAMVEGFQLSTEEQATLDSNISMLNLYAQLYGFKDADKYLQSMYGNGSSLESYTEYTKISTIANAFYSKYSAELRYDDTAIRAYEKTNESYYATFNTNPLANVRHLLVAFEGGTTAADGSKTYTQAEKDAAKVKAENLLSTWKNGAKTEESFIELVKLHTDDEGSKETGGLYEDIHPQSSYVPNFLNWAVDPNRRVGDVGVVPTEYGYHIMYFSSFDELTYRDYMIREDMRIADTESWYNAIVDGATATLKSTKNLNLDIAFASFAQS